MNLHKNVKLMLFLGRSILFQLFFAFKMAYFLFQLRGYLDFVQKNYKINHLKVANFPKVAQKVDTAVLEPKSCQVIGLLFVDGNFQKLHNLLPMFSVTIQPNPKQTN